MAQRRRGGATSPLTGDLAEKKILPNPAPRSWNIHVPDAARWVLLFAATLVAYWPALQGAMLWDDNKHITTAALQSWHGLGRIWFDVGATQQYYPLLHSAFWVEHRIWGDAVVGYHLTNVFLHALCACLVVLIMRRLALPGAWLAGFLFALHPVGAESVAWISEQKNTLSGVFCLGAALAYLRFDQTRRKASYFLALGLFMAAVLSKSVTATLPAALLVVLWWRRGHVGWRRDVAPLAPWLALGVCAGGFTAWVERAYIGAQGSDFALTLVERCLLAGRVMWFYVTKLVWPANLVFIYPRWQVDASQWWQYLFPVGVLAVAAGLVVAARRNRGPLAGFLIFAGTLFPALGFLNVYPFLYSYVADHFQYLACLGLIIPAAVALTRAAARIRLGQAGGMFLPAALVVTLGVLTWGQAGKYRDSETLYRETLARNPESWMAHNDLGNALLGSPERLPEIIAEYQAAVRIKPDYWEAHTNLGNALSQAGRLPEAIAEFQAALRVKPDLAEAHYGLANAFARTPGRLLDAIAEYQATVRANPALEDAHLNLGNALSMVPGRLAEAVAEYRAALRIRPDMAEAHYNLGNALAQMPGRLRDAVTEYQAAVRIQPDYWEAHTNLGNALSQLPGRLEDAIAEYQTALKINPNFAETHVNLANALSQVPGRINEAISEYQEALLINPGLAPVQQALARLRATGK